MNKRFLFLLVASVFLFTAPVARASVTVLPEKAKDHFEMGRTHAKYKEYDKAISEFKKSSEIFPYFLTDYNIALVYMDKGDMESATEYFEKAHVKKPKDIEINFNYGMALLELKKYKEALPKLEFAFNENPKNFDFAYNLGMTLLELKRFEDALPKFDLILSKYPKDETILKLVERAKKGMGGKK